MADSLLKSKHAFGSTEGIDGALQAGTIDAFDILFLDGDTNPKIGWIDKDGNKVIVEDKKQVVTVSELPTTDIDSDVLYIYQNESYIYNGTEFVNLTKPTDVSNLETKVSNLETQMGDKIDASVVDEKIATALADSSGGEVVEF